MTKQGHSHLPPQHRLPVSTHPAEQPCRAVGSAGHRWLLGEAAARTSGIPVLGAVIGLFGMGTHGAGVAKANQIGAEEGSVAGLVVVLVGLVNVLAAPLLAFVLR